MELNFIFIGLLIVYFISLIIVGIFTSKNMKSLEDFLLAGRELSPSILSLTFSSTGMSGWLALGFAGYTYEKGFKSLWIMVPSATIGIFLCYVLIGNKIRSYSEKTGSITVTEVIKKRFYDNKNTLTMITTGIICTAAIVYVSGQLIATGKLLQIILNWDYQFSIIIAAIIMVSYTVLGGFVAVCWTDFIQGILMIFGSLMASTLTLLYTGGINELSIRLAKVNHSYPDFIITPFASTSVIVMGISLFLGDGIFNWLGQPTLMVRYMAAKNSKTLALAPILSISIQLILFIGVFLVAIYMRTQFPEPSLLPYSGDTETVFIQFFITMTHPIFVGIIISSIMAAIMSTADSLLMLAASVLVNDVYTHFKPKSSQRNLINMSRVVTTMLGLIAIFLSLNGSSVLWSSWFGWTTLSLIGIPIIIGLYWENATKEGAIWGLISGFIILVIWNMFDLTQKLNIFHALPACGVTYIITIIVSQFTSKPPAHVIEDIIDLNSKNKKANRGEVEVN